MFRSPRPSNEHIEDFYREQYDSHYGRTEAGSDRAPVFDSALAHLSTIRSPPGCLLDIGCGDGEFLERCRDAGWTCFGLELSRNAMERAQARGFTMLPPTWLDHPDAQRDGTGRFKAVALINVLETVQDPVGLLVRIREVVSPEGVLLIRVSNGRFHLALRRPAGWFGLRYQQAFHLFLYTPQALGGMLRASGWNVVSVRNSYPSQAPLTGGDRLLRRLLWRVAGTGLWVAAQTAYYLSGKRVLWAPSFELIARTDGARRAV
ncbi:MAG: class I SAM-dependent methyltransferase [Nitrospirales bacterium]